MVTAKIKSAVDLSIYRHGAVLIVLMLLSIGTATAGEYVFRFGTGGSAGTYFPIGSLLAKAVNKQDVKINGGDTLKLLPQRSSGSVANLRDIANNLLQGGFAQADVVSLAYQRVGQFKALETDKLRTIGTLYLESMHLVVADGSGINGIVDLAGKRVSVDELGSGTEQDVAPILKAYDMSFDSIKPIYLKAQDSIDRMRRGQLDAFFVVAGHPVTGIKALVEDGVGRVVSLEGSRIEKIAEQFGYFTLTAIPKNVYSNDSEIRTLSVPAQLIVHADIDDEVVYEVTRCLWSEDTLHTLAVGHPRGADIKTDTALEGVSIPLHPGAARFYVEQGYDLSDIPK